MKRIILLVTTLIIGTNAHSQNSMLTSELNDLTFYALPYEYNSLEPIIDAQTVEIHYIRHHKGYFDNFIKLAKEQKLDNITLLELFDSISKYPVGIRNNAGGYYNHVLYWENFKPGNRKGISKALNEAIVRDFGSIENLIAKVNDAALKRFGSGWAWVVVVDNGLLKVCSTQNQDNPLMDNSEVKGIPIIAVDVWEHAYYLKYKNKRADYVNGIWDLINWEEVSELYANALKK